MVMVILRTYLLCLLCCSLRILVAELITLKSEQNITCVVTESLINSSIQSESTVVEYPFHISGQTNLSVVTQQNGTTLHLDESQTKTKVLHLPSKTEWQHYIVSLEDKAILKPEDETFKEIALDFKPIKISVRNADLVFWATSKYNVLTIPPCTTTCSDIVIFKNSNNSLKINFTSVMNDSESLEITIGENFTPAKSWEQCLIKIEPNKEIKLFLYEKNKENTFMSDCSLNVLYKNDTIVYRNVPKDTCSDFASKTETQDQFNQTCLVGYIGASCNITCEAILGPEYPLCEKHEICEGGICFCSWGFRGSFCNETCDSKTWGLSCKRNCPDCENCDKLTGKCPYESTTSSAAVVAGIALSILGVIIIIIIAIYVYKTYIKKDTHEGQLEMGNLLKTMNQRGLEK